MAKRFTAKEKAMLHARFAEHSPKVWACGDVATVHVFGGHYYIRKRESGYDWRWADANTFKEMATPLRLNHIASLRFEGLSRIANFASVRESFFGNRLAKTFFGAASFFFAPATCIIAFGVITEVKSERR